MSVLKNLEPQLVWHYFEEITRVPRPSKHEEKIIEYLVNFAITKNLEYKVDETGNVVILKPATTTISNRPTVILQSHMDMVCEKNSGVEFDFMRDPIKIKILDGWVGADGTTLGADCGIGMAAALALLAEEGIEHPNIEALFTVDEESGLTGAFGLSTNMLSGKYLINLDSEDEGEIFVGCAGGVDTLATFRYTKQNAPSEYQFYELNLSGLKGGHSGDDINKGYANSNKVASHFLWRVMKSSKIVLCSFDGGNLRNAIPREATVIFGIPEYDCVKIDKIFNEYTREVAQEYGILETKLQISLNRVASQLSIVSTEATEGLINSLVAVDNGVIAMSQSIPELVETSTNLASVKFTEENTIVVTSSQRSSLTGAKSNAAATIETTFALAGAEVVHSDGYPGWSPNLNSRLLEVSKASYLKLFGVEPKVRAIHAGLECGLFLEKYPELDMISFGPTLRGVHSPDERLEISTVDKFWRLLIATIQSI